MRLAAQERRREGNEPQTTKVAHHAAYPRHEGFEVEIKEADACAVDASRELQAVVGVGAVPAVSRLQPADVALDVVGGAAGGVPGAEGMEVEVMNRTKLSMVIAMVALVGAVFVFVTCVLAVFGICDTEEWQRFRLSLAVMLFSLSVMGFEIVVLHELKRLRDDVRFLKRVIFKGENYE